MLLKVLLDKYGYAHWATSPDGKRGRYERYELNKNTLYVGPGRPLGFEFVADDVLIVCDSVKGLIMVGRRSMIFYTICIV
jgi:hypothetical protein